MRIKIFLFASLLGAFILTGCTDEASEAKTIVEDNSSFDDLKYQSNKTFNLKTTDNKEIILNLEGNVLTSKLKGKVIVLNFWATWCPPCIEEMPMFNKLHDKYPDKLALIGILFEKNKNKDELAAFIKKHKMKFPVTVGPENFRLSTYFDEIKMVPESYVFDQNGKFLKKFVGVVDEKELESFITK